MAAAPEEGPLRDEEWIVEALTHVVGSPGPGADVTQLGMPRSRTSGRLVLLYFSSCQ